MIPEIVIEPVSQIIFYAIVAGEFYSLHELVKGIYRICITFVTGTGGVQ